MLPLRFQMISQSCAGLMSVLDRDIEYARQTKDAQFSLLSAVTQISCLGSGLHGASDVFADLNILPRFIADFKKGEKKKKGAKSDMFDYV